MNTENNAMARIIAKAWADDNFKARLERAPAETLAAEGISIPEGVTVKVVENTPTLAYLVLPPKPEGGEISEDALEGVSGGFTGNYCHCYCGT